MGNEKKDRNNYDIASISRTNSEKRANYVQDALHISKQAKPTGQFVKVFSDMFLKQEAGKKSYF